jgi:hypothetical protein
MDKEEKKKVEKLLGRTPSILGENPYEITGEKDEQRDASPETQVLEQDLYCLIMNDPNYR